MAIENSGKALLLLDFINEIVHPNGKLSSKGYSNFDSKHNILDNVRKILDYARSNNYLVAYVKLGFSSDYKEQPENSPLFGGAKKFNALTIGTWATEIHEKIHPLDNESVLIKHRVSGFFNTALETLLRVNKISSVYITGCATDMAVQSTARDAHDRDFQVFVIDDCCIAANENDHENSLSLLSKVATVVKMEEIINSNFALN